MDLVCAYMGDKNLLVRSARDQVSVCMGREKLNAGTVKVLVSVLIRS